MANNSSNTSVSVFPVKSQCLFDEGLYDQYCLIPALIIITILAFLNKRVWIQLNICDGRPGLVLPLNFLGNSNINRLSMAVAFGVVANNCFQLFSEIIGFVHSWLTVTELVGHGPWDEAFRSLAWILLYGVVNFPIFACLMTEHLLVGAVFGFLYTLMKFIAATVLLSSCSRRRSHIQSIQQNRTEIPYVQKSYELNSAIKQSEVFMRLPDVLCYLFLVLRFGGQLIKLVIRRWKELDINRQKPVIAHEHDKVHVRLLLTNKLNERFDDSDNWFVKMLNRLYKPRQDFKFSTEMIAIWFVSLILIYQMTVSTIIGADVLEQWLPTFREGITHVKTNPVAYQINYSLMLLLEFVGASLRLCAGFSAFFSVVLLLHFVKSHRKHVLMTYKSKQVVDQSPSRLVFWSFSYAGYQIAYTGCGYIVLTILLLLIAICIGTIVKTALGPLFVLPVCVLIVQFLLGRFVFRDRHCPDETININNHRLYCVTSFFFFFCNILVGFFLSIVRVFRSIYLGVIFLSRIDRKPLMLGFHQWDEGHMSYIGFLNVLKSLNHPVMLVFCQLLLDRHRLGSRLGYDDLDRRAYHPKAAVRRWFVAYTLVRNPLLRDHRKRYM